MMRSIADFRNISTGGVRVRVIVPAVLSVFLMACGGGSGSSASSDNADADNNDNPDDQALEVPRVPANCAEADFAQEMLASINRYRAEARNCGDQFRPAVDPLTWNCLLEQSALAHTYDMTRNNFFSHTSSDGGNLSARVNKAGYLWSGIGENIAAGQQTIAQVMAGWINSPGHCRNIMNGDFTEVGATSVTDATADFGIYWTQNFGRPR